MTPRQEAFVAECRRRSDDSADHAVACGIQGREVMAMYYAHLADIYAEEVQWERAVSFRAEA